MEEFKDRIKELRIANEMTCAQLAAKIGRGESAVRMWESGKSKPDMDTVLKLREIFDCSVDYLFGISEFVNVDAVKSYKNVLEVMTLPATVGNIPSDDLKTMIKQFTCFLGTYSLLKGLGKELADDFLTLVFKTIPCMAFLDIDFDRERADYPEWLYELEWDMHELTGLLSEMRLRLVDKIYTREGWPKKVIGDKKINGVKITHADDNET